MLRIQLITSGDTRNQSMNVFRYPCDQCKYTVNTSSALGLHKESNHECIRYPCDQFEYAASSSSTLILHKESKHEGRRYKIPV